jgi:hypothetical protein
MSKAIEKVWVSILDSARFRKFSGGKIGTKLFRSDFFRQLRLAKNRVSTRIASIQNPDMFKDVRTFVFFIGHNKSGTSMIGSLLDAHPNAILSDEVGALDLLNSGFDRDQVFHLLVRGSRREHMKGRVTARRLTPYSYLVPGMWQGRYQQLNLIGDGKAGSTTNLFSKYPDLLKRLPDLMAGPELKIIQIIRNPFDVISVMMVRGKRSFENSISHFFNYCEILDGLRKMLGPAVLHPIRYEDFVLEPRKRLEDLCHHLGIDPLEAYLDACTSIIYEAPDQHRQRIAWEPKYIEFVEEEIKKYDFLAGYSFE